MSPRELVEESLNLKILHRTQEDILFMQIFEMSATLRQEKGKNAAYRLRQEGKIPAVYYGKGEKNLMLTVDPRMLEKAVTGESGMNTLIKLKVEGNGDFNVLLKDYQANAITRYFTHADFIHVDLSKKMVVSIPVHLTGSAQGVKDGGVLQHVTRELEVLCLPTHIPKEIIVDVTNLKVGQNIHLHDVKLPEGSEVVGETDITIAAVLATREEAAAEPTAMVEPEVLTAKKTDDAAGDKKADGDAKSKK